MERTNLCVLPSVVRSQRYYPLVTYAGGISTMFDTFGVLGAAQGVFAKFLGQLCTGWTSHVFAGELYSGCPGTFSRYSRACLKRFFFRLLVFKLSMRRNSKKTGQL